MKIFTQTTDTKRSIFSSLCAGLFLVMSFFLSLAAQAQNDEPKSSVKTLMQLSAKSLFAGESVTLSVLVSGSDQVSKAPLPQVDGLTIRFIDELPVKDRDLQGYAIRYEVLARKAGVFTIPPMLLEIDGKDVFTKSFVFTVKQPDRLPGMEIDVQVSKQECFVGEALLVTFTWRSPLPFYNFRAVDIDLPLFNHYAFQIFDPLEKAPAENVAIGLPVSDNRVIALRGREKQGEQVFDTIRFQKVIVPRQSGEFTLDPTSLLCSYLPMKVDAQRRRDWRPQYPSYFNNDFFNATTEDETFKKFYAETKKMTIKVKALPSTGRPQNFNGLVGACKISTTASPISLNAGDPLTLSIVVTGHSFSPLVDLPNLAKLAAFQRSFAIPPKHSSARYKGKDKFFTRTLRPLTAGNKAIPAIGLSYFDPEKEAYFSVSSEAIAITVKEAESVNGFDAELSGDAKLENKLSKNPEGIRHNDYSPAALENNKLSPITIFLLLLKIPIVLYLLIKLLSADSRFKERDPLAYRKMKAFAIFKKTLKSLKPSDTDALELTVRQYFSDKFGFALQAHTFEDLMQKLQDSAQNEESTAILQKLYHQRDLQKYSPKKGEGQQINHGEILSCISTINKEIKNV